MKTKGICPKCNSDEVIKIPGTPQSHGYGNNIKVGITIFSAILITKYLCCNCGFIEEWIDDSQDIEKIKSYYNK